MKKGITKFMTVLSLIAILTTMYLIILHYRPLPNAPCDLNDSINCTSINKSIYSEFFQAIGLEEFAYALGFDIPVAILGFLTYCILFILAVILYKNIEFTPKYLIKKYALIIFILSLIGFLFSLYLTYVEFFVLYTVCLFCLLQAIIITIILILSIILLRSK